MIGGEDLDAVGRGQDGGVIAGAGADLGATGRGEGGEGLGQDPSAKFCAAAAAERTPGQVGGKAVGGLGRGFRRGHGRVGGEAIHEAAVDAVLETPEAGAGGGEVPFFGQGGL